MYYLSKSFESMIIPLRKNPGFQIIYKVKNYIKLKLLHNDTLFLFDSRLETHIILKYCQTTDL